MARILVCVTGMTHEKTEGLKTMDFEWVAIALGDVTWITLAFCLGFLA